MEKANKTLQKECIRPLLKWYRVHARDLPWRRTTDSYAIWVSEIMLQQTQVATVIPYWERWMDQLPTISSAANATIDQILKLWEGLGYYRRVRLLQKAAIAIVDQHHGIFPTDDDSILALPGIGPYTAGAIASIAFDKPSPILDGNVIRVLTRYYGIAQNTKSSECLSKLWHLSKKWVQQADQLRPRAHHNCSHLNQAMMELGAQICLPGQLAKCGKCPLQQACNAYRNGTVIDLPNLPKRRAMVPQHRLVVVLCYQGNFLVQRRQATDFNEGLWEFFNEEIIKPLGRSVTNKAAKKMMQTHGIPCSNLEFLGVIKHTITHHRITLHCFTGVTQSEKTPTNEGFKWLSKSEIKEAPMPSAHHKIRLKLLQLGRS